MSNIHNYWHVHRLTTFSLLKSGILGCWKQDSEKIKTQSVSKNCFVWSVQTNFHSKFSYSAYRLIIRHSAYTVFIYYCVTFLKVSSVVDEVGCPVLLSSSISSWPSCTTYRPLFWTWHSCQKPFPTLTLVHYSLCYF